MLTRFRLWLCRRWGHKPRIRKRTGYRKVCYTDPSFYSGVARRAVERTTVCRRCAEELSARDVQEGALIQSLSLPSDLMEQYDKRGEVWI